MSERGAETDIPPIYRMNTWDTLSFILGVIICCEFLAVFLLYVSGADDLLLMVLGVASAIYYWPTIPARVRAAVVIYQLKKDIKEHKNI